MYTLLPPLPVFFLSHAYTHPHTLRSQPHSPFTEPWEQHVIPEFCALPIKPSRYHTRTVRHGSAGATRTIPMLVNYGNIFCILCQKRKHTARNDVMRYSYVKSFKKKTFVCIYIYIIRRWVHGYWYIYW